MVAVYIEADMPVLEDGVCGGTAVVEVIDFIPHSVCYLGQASLM